MPAASRREQTVGCHVIHSLRWLAAIRASASVLTWTGRHFSAPATTQKPKSYSWLTTSGWRPRNPGLVCVSANLHSIRNGAFVPPSRDTMKFSRTNSAAVRLSRDSGCLSPGSATLTTGMTSASSSRRVPTKQGGTIKTISLPSVTPNL